MKRLSIEEGLPIYEVIKRRIRESILKGELRPGDPVPSEHRLARELRVSRNQTRQALRELELEGLIERSRGRGSFVAHRQKQEARRLIRTGSRMVSLAYPRFSRHGRTLYFQRLLKGFSNRLVEQGVEPVFHYLDLHQDAELRFLQNVSLNGAEGLALMPHYRSREECELVEELCDGGFPCVLFDHSLPGLQADFVGTANRQAFQRLTDELLSRGHDRLGYVAYNLEHSVMEDRLAGYRCSLARAGIPYREEQVVNCEIIEPDQRLEKALSAARTIERLITGETPPTAFVCSDGLTASFLCECLNRRGLEVPGDVEIATVDDNADPNEDVRLPWLIALQDGAEIGRLTADLLLARIAQPDKNIEQHYVQVRFLFERYDALSEKQRERTKGR